MNFVFEGPDGCGKDSVANLVAKHLEVANGRLAPVRLNFPNDNGYTGPMIRSYLRKAWHVSVKSHWDSKEEKGDFELNTFDDEASALAFQALQVANRMEVMPMLARSASSFTYHTVMARYWQSAWVYGQLDGLDEAFLTNVHAAMAPGNYNFLLDVPAEVCMERRARRDGALPPERYEGKLEATKRIVDLYRDCWGKFGVPKENELWVVIDATQPLEKVVRDVLGAIDV